MNEILPQNICFEAKKRVLFIAFILRIDIFIDKCSFFVLFKLLVMLELLLWPEILILMENA